MSGERPAGGSVPPPAPGDDELRAMLQGRASRVTAADVREVLATTRVEIAGPSAAGSEVGERGGRTFGVRPVRIDRPEGVDRRRRGSRMGWRVAVLGIAAVVAVAVLGSRLGLGPTVPDAGSSPTSSDVAVAPGGAATLEPLRVLSAAELAAGMADGSIDGRTVLVSARTVTDPVPCPTATEDCFDLHIEGQVSIPLSRTAAVTIAAYRRNVDAGTPVAVQVAGGRATLLGWVVGGLDPVMRPTHLFQNAAMPSGDLVVVTGWLLAKPADPPCIRLALCEAWPKLTDAKPIVDGRPAHDTFGVNVGVDATIGLDGPARVMVGRFLVESLGARASLLPPYRVVATLDAEVLAVEQPVTPTETPPTPTAAPATAGHMTAEDFARALRLGEVDGRVVVVEGRLRLAAGRCRGTSEDCTWLQLEGLDGVFIGKGDLSVDEAGAAIRRHPNVEPIALRVSEGGAHLIGWISAGASTPVDVAALRAGGLPLDPGDVAVVAGWLLGAPALPPCSATPETCAMWPMLSPFEAIPGVILYGDMGMAVMVAESLGLPPAPATMKGPFMVAAWRAPSTGEPGFEVVERFTDVMSVDAPLSGSVAPAPAVRPAPTPAAPISPPAGVLTADELVTALATGSLDGRLLVMDVTELKTVAWQCPGEVPEPCTRFYVDGLPGIALTYRGVIAGSDGSDGGAGVSTVSGRMIVVPRNGHLELLGRQDGDLEAPLAFDDALAVDDGAVPDPFGLRPVSGWLIHTPAPSGCPPDVPNADVSCVGDSNILSPQPPEGESLPASAAQRGVVVRGGPPGLEGFGTFASGPFLVRPWHDVVACPSGTDCLYRTSYEWEVVARYDLVSVVQVLLP